MSCEKCGTAVVSLYAKADDRQCVSASGAEGFDEIDTSDGYAPHIKGVCGGDDVNLRFCPFCGQIHGFEPFTAEELKEKLEGC